MGSGKSAGPSRGGGGVGPVQAAAVATAGSRSRTGRGRARPSAAPASRGGHRYAGAQCGGGAARVYRVPSPAPSRGEDIAVERTAGQRLLEADGLSAPVPPALQPGCRARRAPCPSGGTLLQADGMRHAERRELGPMLALIDGIDDATGTEPSAGSAPRGSSALPGLASTANRAREGAVSIEHVVWEPGR